MDKPNAFPPEVWELFLLSTARPWGEMPPDLRGDDVEAPYCGRDNERMKTGYGGA